MGPYLLYTNLLIRSFIYSEDKYCDCPNSAQ